MFDHLPLAGREWATEVVVVTVDRSCDLLRVE